MGESLISYKTMVATQYSSYWSLGSMFAAIVSAIAAVTTVVIACKALNTWKQQEELKAKIEFKLALIELADVIDVMPRNWSRVQVNIARGIIERGEVPAHREKEVEIFYQWKDLSKANREAGKRWMLCDKLYTGTKIEEDWKKFNSELHSYKMRGGNSTQVLPILSRIIENLAIF